VKPFHQYLLKNVPILNVIIDDDVLGQIDKAVKEWLQEQLQTSTAKKWEVDEIDLYVIKTNLIARLGQ
jgi:hypothetical protein